MNDAIDFIDCVILISPHLRYKTIKELQAFELCYSCFLLVEELIGTLRKCSGFINISSESMNLSQTLTNDFKNLSGAALKDAISAAIKAKQGSLVGNMASQGTTPRQLTDLIGSLCDLTSGSGDKGTPVVLVQGYFDNFTD